MDVYRQLTTRRPDRSLRWTADEGVSIRAYTTRASDAWPCVSPTKAELTFVLDGATTMLVGPQRQPFTARAGDVFIVPSGLPHTVVAEPSSRVLVLDTPVPHPELGVRFVRGARLPARIVGAVDHAWGLPAAEAVKQILAIGEEALARVKDGTPIQIEPAASTAKMLRAKRILDRAYARPPSIPALARMVGVDEYYLIRNFKRNFAFTPGEYSHFIRLARFCELLVSSAEPGSLTQLCRQLGYRDYATFSRRIRAECAVPPSRLVDRDCDTLGV